mgnify:CR=1 FL=1
MASSRPITKGRKASEKTRFELLLTVLDNLDQSGRLRELLGCKDVVTTPDSNVDSSPTPFGLFY